MAQQQLSGKEQTLFRTLVKFYEAKQYKKAVKTAEQILKKTPDHADTIAMKALTLNAQGQTDEAFVLAKAALQKNMKSPICWHVYGLLYRSVKNLEEATKAYKFALRLDPESQQIQRDLAFLQVQSRDYQGYIQTRNDILQARPAIRANWNSLAVAYHLSGDPEEAERRLKTYEDTLKRPPMRMDHEHSEAQLYRNDLIAEQGDIERALEHLETIYKTNLDRTAVMEKKAKYLLQLGRKEEAEKAYRVLLARNSEYRPYYESLEKCLSLDRSSSGDTAKLAELYASFAAKNDRLDAPHRIPLDFLQGEEFKAAAQKYLQRMLSRGVPSTFNNVKSLYQDTTKRDTIQAIVEDISSESSDTKATNGDGPDKFQLAKLYFLAQHYNYHRSQDLSKAMKYIDQAIELNPKMVDLLMTKARIYKHMGDSQLAAKTMNEARELDLKDRYINTKCAKYHLRNNDNEKALDTMSKFTRNETVGGPLGDLHDMQCVWFITEDGEANLRQGKYGLALKRFKAIYDIFETWQEDQFDFHHFSFRKGQIRAYVEMMKWEDHLREHPFYTRAALSAIKTYILLHDKPDIATSNGMPDFEGLSAEEKKKAVKKAKKEQEKLEKAEMDRREAEKKAQKAKANADGEVKKEDPDPFGNRLLETKTPLDEAAKYLAPILEFSPRSIEGQKIGFEVFIRRKKYLLALKCLRTIQSVDAENPALHEDLVRLRLALDSQTDSPDPKTAEVLKACADIVPAKADLSSFNDSFLNKHKESAQHVQHALQTRSILDPPSKSQNEKDLLATIDLPSTTMGSTAAGLELLAGWKSDKAVKDQYLQVARKRWPDATIFKEMS